MFRKKGRKPKDITNLKYNNLIALKFLYLSKSKQPVWLFRCICGNEKAIIKGFAISLRINSCGCLKVSRSKPGERYIYSRSYKIWAGMKYRCNNTNETRRDYKYYKKRGIVFCERWDKFENFLKDMGDPPLGKTLDRIDNNKGYFKENCRWATNTEQKNNTTKNIYANFNNKKQSVAEWSRELSLNYHTLKYHLKKGKSLEEVLLKLRKIK